MAAMALTGAAYAASPSSETSRLVIKFKPSAKVQAQSISLKAQLGSKINSDLKFVRKTSTGSAVYDLGTKVSPTQASDIARRLSSDPRIQSAEPDFRVKPQHVPADPYYNENQWNLKSAIDSIGGMNAPALWTKTLGSNAIVAVIDTGILQHPELSDRIIGGYDFIDDIDSAGDGDGRDSDPTDEGNFCELDGSRSSWHGTMVAGNIAASTDSIGITGVTPQARLLDARALGRCGGWTTDIADAILWSAGRPVAGAAPHNQGPVVINLSLGTEPGIACPAFMQDAVDQAISAGSIVVASTGNESASEISSPANCTGVISVSAHTRNGDLAAYANYSNTTTVSGPAGGACKQSANCLGEPAVSLGVNGTTTFTSFRAPVFFSGTSSSAPLVSATLAALRTIERSLTASQAASWLRSSSRPFPAGTFCHNNPSCGFGMFDAGNLIDAATAYFTPTVTLTASARKVTPAAAVTITASAHSQVPGTTLNYSWSQKSGTQISPQDLASAGSTLSFTAPEVSGAVVLEVTVTDSDARMVKDSITVLVDAGASTPVITQPESSSAEPNRRWTLTPNITDAESNVDRLVITSGPDGLVAEGVTLVWASPTPGTHTVTFIAVDASGLESEPVTLDLTVTASSPVDTTPPTSSGGGGTWGVLGSILMMLAFALKRMSSNKIR